MGRLTKVPPSGSTSTSDELKPWVIGVEVVVKARNLQQAMDLGAVVQDEIELLARDWMAEAKTYRQIEEVVEKEVMPTNTSSTGK